MKKFSVCGLAFAAICLLALPACTTDDPAPPAMQVSVTGIPQGSAFFSLNLFAAAGDIQKDPQWKEGDLKTPLKGYAAEGLTVASSGDPQKAAFSLNAPKGDYVLVLGTSSSTAGNQGLMYITGKSGQPGKVSLAGEGETTIPFSEFLPQGYSLDELVNTFGAPPK
jgi:hypothetical protein